MARPSKRQTSSDEALSDGSNPSDEELVDNEEQEQAADDDVDEEELEAVARSASSSDEDDEAPASAEDGGDGEGDDEVLVYYPAVRFCCVFGVRGIDLGVFGRVLHGWVFKSSYDVLDWSFSRVCS